MCVCMRERESVCVCGVVCERVWCVWCVCVSEKRVCVCACVRELCGCERVCCVCVCV